MQENTLYEAKWWEYDSTGKILCTLCPRYCTIGEGQQGFCYIRQNINGRLYSIGYGRPTGFAIDPIEKKPLNHFMPGTQILSFGTAGCNLGCKFCQNWSISKARLDDLNALSVSPAEVVALALKYNVPSIAYTYNDPVIFGEYVIDISRLAKEKNIKNVLVTAGYIDKNARPDVFRYADAANVDLKAFTERFYHKITFSHIQNVLDTLLWLKNETNIWIEITTLLIPGENDSPDEIGQLSRWVKENLGNEVPIHFTAFHPDFKMTNKPHTPLSTLLEAKKIAENEGIVYCYIGNVHHKTAQNTYCKKCKTLLIERDWHTVRLNNLVNGACYLCGEKVAGVF